MGWKQNSPSTVSNNGIMSTMLLSLRIFVKDIFKIFSFFLSLSAIPALANAAS